jgi:hypothetical protein
MEEMSAAINYTRLLQDENVDDKHDTIRNKLFANDNKFVFITKLYKYYEHGGYLNTIVSLLLKVFTVQVLLGMLLVVSDMVMWRELLNGTLPHTITGVPYLIRTPSKEGLWTWCGSSLFLWLVSMGFIFKPVRTAWRMRTYYKNVLGLTDSDLSTMPWDLFVQHLAEKDKTLLSYNGTQWQHLVMILTRKQNYLVALYNQQLIDMAVPCFPQWRSVTIVFEWWFEWATRHLWTSDGQVDAECIAGDFTQVTQRLRKSFVLAGFLSLLLAPLVLLSMLVFAFFGLVDEARNGSGIILGHQWTRLARWRLRCFDEVDCCLKDRLAVASEEALRYTQQFKSRSAITLVRFVSYVLIAIATPMILVTMFFNDAVLNYQLWDGLGSHTLLVTGGLLAAALAATRSLLPKTNLVPRPQLMMNRLFKHVRLPAPSPVEDGVSLITSLYEWQKDAHTAYVCTQFSNYFKSKPAIFLSELAAVITVPFILIFSLSHDAEKIIRFLRENTVDVGYGLGTMCAQSGLCCEYNSLNLQTSQQQLPLVLSSSSSDQLIKTQQSEALARKMEESVLAFKGHYPHWTPTSSDASDLLNASDVHYYSTSFDYCITSPITQPLPSSRMKKPTQQQINVDEMV